MAAGSFAEGLVGVVLDGRYRLDAVLGEGGMGSVFRAQHLAMDRRVAVKLLKPHLTQDHTALERFTREARATLRVDSPHAVKVLDFGVTPHGDYYMALEYLDGRTVQRELEVDGPFAPLRVLHIARHCLHALGAAHKSGLVHRDLKPDNILLIRVGEDPDYAKLLDFGVAKLMEGAARSSRSELKLTQAGMVFGTPEFMSPEQACGHELDPRSDLYSLGATMFAMLTGCGLFEGTSAIEWLTHHVRTPPPHLADVEPSLAAFPELDAAIQACLAKQRDQRPRSAEELDATLAELEAYVARGGRSAPASNARFRTAMSASSYFQALPSDTLVPPPVEAPALETGDVPVASSRRGLYLALGAIGVLAVVVLAIGFAVRKRDGRTERVVEPVTKAVDARANHDAAVALIDAAPVDAAVVVITPDARPTVTTPSRPPRGNAKAMEHLAAAEAAARSGNRLRQLAEADLALKADPRNVRARYLLADALIQGGDLERGCAYLRALGRNPLAVARAKSARCPTD